eukprot:4322625-Prymnesium_polylepis.3
MCGQKRDRCRLALELSRLELTTSSVAARVTSGSAPVNSTSKLLVLSSTLKSSGSRSAPGERYSPSRATMCSARAVKLSRRSMGGSGSSSAPCPAQPHSLERRACILWPAAAATHSERRQRHTHSNLRESNGPRRLSAT